MLQLQYISLAHETFEGCNYGMVFTTQLTPLKNKKKTIVDLFTHLHHFLNSGSDSNNYFNVHISTLISF